MTKVIVLSTVLGLSALGMACGEAANTNVTVKPANNSNAMAPVSTPAPVSPATPVATAPAGNATNKPAANAPAANAPKANAPVASPTKKP